MNKRFLIATGLLLVAGTCFAHPGHLGQGGTAHPGILAGFVHPLGLDHLLAMLAVGLWSATALPAERRLHGPLAFMATMLAGAALGRSLGAPGLVEPALALSVVVFGGLIALPRLLSVSTGLMLAWVLVVLAGGLHGLAHGAELPADTGFAGYAFGFVATTALLQAAGLALGSQIQALPRRLAGWSTRVLAGGLGAAGVALLLQA
jgi:urease accessory protein